MSSTSVTRAMLTARTIRNLRPAQIIHRARLRALRWPAAQPVGAALAALSAPRADEPPGWPRVFRPLDLEVPVGYPTAEDNAVGTFEFLNDRRTLGHPPRWHQPGASRLWRYHLHYHEWAWSFAAHADRAWAAAAFLDLWRSWSRASPFGRGDEWSPYVTSLRAWVLCGIYPHLIAGGEAEEEVLGILARHATYLRWHMEHDVGGNHLVKNLKAIVGLGVFLGDDRLVRVARRQLQRQLTVQILADGGHYERSPSYHCQVLGDLIDVANLLKAAGGPPVPGLDEAITRMRRWLGLMRMPDGDIPLFNDCTFVGLDRLAQLEPGPGATERLTVLQPSGYVVVRPDDRVHLVADVGVPCPPDLPAHAHADCLSFELAVDGVRRIVDTGTSTYEPGPRRAFERSTAAHNTVAVDGQDQTEVWAVFRAARLARPRLERADDDGTAITVAASHDGYRRLRGRPEHRRTWVVRPDAVDITDDMAGTGEHRLESRFHLAGPNPPDPSAMDWSGSPGMTVDVEPATVATGFGQEQPARVVVARWSGPLPARLHVRMDTTPTAPSGEGMVLPVADTARGTE